MLEERYRHLFPDGCRYWESDLAEFDAVRFADETGKSIIVSEIKWRRLGKKDRDSQRKILQNKFEASSLKKRYLLADIEILDFDDVIAAISKE